jgi:hypothetical protein
MGNEHPYPQLALQLQDLAGDALLLWGNTNVCRQALEAIITAWESGSGDLEAAVAHLDTAICDGLRALELPRGPVRALRIESMRLGLSGQKLPDCTLILVGERMRSLVRQRGEPDAAIRTWIHESLHARQPYAPEAGAEYRSFRGYEEGLTEGLTQCVQAAAVISVSETPFAFYVAAYRALADALHLEVEHLWRALWAFPVGEVRKAFVTTAQQL